MNYFRHGVSKRAFNAIDSYTWERITYWLRQKHRIGWSELRRRFCLTGTWRLAHDGERFRGAATVTVTRYRYRGYRILTPWNANMTRLPGRQCATRRPNRPDGPWPVRTAC